MVIIGWYLKTYLMKVTLMLQVLVKTVTVVVKHDTATPALPLNSV